MSVRLSGCPTLVMRQNWEPKDHEFSPSVAQDFQYFNTNFHILVPGKPLARASNESGVGKNGEKDADFRPINRHIT